MTDVLTPAEAGWYPDPSGVADRRFWDGGAWTEHPRWHAHQVVGRAPAAAPVHAHTLQRVPDPIASADRFAVLSMVFGAVSIVANVLLVPTVLGAVFGGIALAHGTARRGLAIAGIACAAGGVVMSILAAVLVYTVLVPLQHAALMQRIGTVVQNQAYARGLQLEPLHCPAPAVVEAGLTVTCTTTTSAGRPVTVDVHFTDSAGSWTWTAR